MEIPPVSAARAAISTVSLVLHTLFRPILSVISAAFHESSPPRSFVRPRDATSSVSVEGITESNSRGDARAAA